MGAPISGKHMVFAIGEELTAFGTPLADAIAMIQLSCEPFVINPDVKHRAPNRSNGKLHPDKANVWNDKLGSVPSASIKTIALKKEIALWLYLLFQKVTEAVATPFEKAFTFPTIGPDFLNATPEGVFCTLVSKSPTASTSEKLTSCIATKLTFDLSAKSGNDTGNLEAEIALLAYAHSRVANPSGALSKTADDRFNFHNFNVCTLGGAVIVLESAKITFDSLWVPRGSNGSGGFQTFALVGQSASVQLSGLWDVASRAGLTALDAGSEVVFILSWGTVATDGYLNFNIHGIIESGAPVEGDSRLVNLNIKGVSDAAEEIATVTVADAKEWTW